MNEEKEGMRNQSSNQIKRQIKEDVNTIKDILKDRKLIRFIRQIFDDNIKSRIRLKRKILKFIHNRYVNKHTMRSDIIAKFKSVSDIEMIIDEMLHDGIVAVNDEGDFVMRIYWKIYNGQILKMD